MGYNSDHHHAPKENHCKQSENQKENNKDCCKDQVHEFQKLDKAVPNETNLVHPAFLNPLSDVLYNVSLPSEFFVKKIKQFVRSYHPPIPDVRIAIQSFQV